MDDVQGECRRDARFRVCRGARSTEDALLAHVGALLDGAAADPALLALPVIVVVPSASLRDHLAAEAVRRRGRAAAGLRVLTVFAVASEVLRHRGETPRGGGRLFDILARRFARREPSLAGPLDALQDGYAAVAAAVRDLLDAGFVTPLAEGVGERIEELARREAWGDTARRAGALVRVAAACDQAAEAAGVDGPGRLLSRAADAVAADPLEALPARAVLVHGFADATGTAGDLLRALLRRPDATVYLDEPPDPAHPGEPDPGVRFVRRFAASLGAAPPREGAVGPAAGSPSLELFHAPGASAEAREVATRVRRLLDAGARPEAILVVARDLGPVALPLRVHLRRLGVPFSGAGAPGPPSGLRRRLAALAALLEHGGGLAVDRWLDAAAVLSPPLDRPAREATGTTRGGRAPAPDLLLALRTLGAGRLAQVAALRTGELIPGGRLRLPVHRGAAAGGDGEETAARSERRTLPRGVVEDAVDAAARLLRFLEGWPARAPLATHLARCRALLGDHLGWREATEGAAEAAEALAAVAADVPAELLLEREEALLLVRRELAGRGFAPLGGAGGGVQVLSVTEARGRTASHLFLLGLNRGAFPRQVTEDPLLPDAFRLALRQDVLPDVPVKGAGHDEERYLFAQLLSAAPRVTLSWQSCDDDGRPVPPSPLVERLRLEGGLPAPQAARSLFAPPVAGATVRPAHEHAVLAGLYGDRATFAAALRAALAGEDGPGAGRAEGRLAVLEELDPDWSTPDGRARREDLGPYFGFVGPAGQAEEEAGELPITALETLAGCPWQAFLRRRLHLEAPPDPLESIPTLDVALVGSTVHGALQRVVTAGGGGAATVEEAESGPSAPVPWPGEPALAALVAAEAGAQAAAAGAPWLAAALARRALPFVRLAGRLDWPAGGTLPVAGAEVRGAFDVPVHGGRPWRVTFRADRVDASEDGLRLTDYKTGRPFSASKNEQTRRRHTLARLRSGRNLQAAAYARGGGAGARGRYLFLRDPGDPGTPDEVRAAELGAADPEAASLLAAVAGAVVEGWRAGVFLPRLLQRDLEHRPAACQYCELLQACLQQDSGAGARLARWVEAARRSGGPAAGGPALETAWRLWSLDEPAGEDDA